jgi:hypothetical protein
MMYNIVKTRNESSSKELELLIVNISGRRMSENKTLETLFCILYWKRKGVWVVASNPALRLFLGTTVIHAIKPCY